MGKSQREKGARGEREVANMFKIFGWHKAKRELSQYQQSSGRDLSGTQPFCVQVKNSNTVNISKAWEEALNSTEHAYPVPVLFVKKDGKWFAVLEASDFFTYYTPTETEEDLYDI